MYGRVHLRITSTLLCSAGLLVYTHIIRQAGSGSFCNFCSPDATHMTIANLLPRLTYTSLAKL